MSFKFYVQIPAVDQIGINFKKTFNLQFPALGLWPLVPMNTLLCIVDLLNRSQSDCRMHQMEWMTWNRSPNIQNQCTMWVYTNQTIHNHLESFCRLYLKRGFFSTQSKGPVGSKRVMCKQYNMIYAYDFTMVSLHGVNVELFRFRMCSSEWI